MIRFYATVIKIAVALAMIGQLKSCTLNLMGLAATKSKTGVMSYSDFNRKLWSGGK